MTILNFALARDRALIVCDSLLTNTAEPECVTKSVLLPHLRAVVAFHGLHRIFLHYVALLNAGLPAGIDVLDIAGESPSLLLDLWRKRGADQETAILIVGATNADELAALYLDSRASFDPRRLPPGVYLTPSIDEPGPQPSDHVQPSERLQPPSWRDCAHSAVAAVETQQRQARVPTGGPLILTELSPDAARQFSLRELPVTGWSPA